MRKLWTPEEIKILKSLFSDTNTSVIATKLNRSYSSVAGAAYSLKLKKSAEFMSSEKSGILIKGHTKGYNTRFKKGVTPSNKGKKMPTHVYEKAKNTMFKKGTIPPNTKYNGAISIRNNKGTIYKWIRVEKSIWIPFHIFIWEQTNGKVPKGFKIIFKDKNQLNCDLANLQMVSNSELMQMNTLHNYPQEIKDLIHVKAVLTRQINKISENE